MNINYLLKDWAWRVNDGMPDPKNRNHLELLEATLRAHKYSEEFINAYISEIEFNTSKDLAKYKAKHKMRKTTKVKIGGEETTVGDAEKKDKSKSNKAKVKKYPKKASGPGWDGKSTDEIIDSVSRKDEPSVIATKGSEDIKNRAGKSRAEAFGGKAGKGGGDTTIQEEMTNIGREISLTDTNITKEEIAKKIAEHVKENYPDSKVAKNEKKLNKLANASIAGFDSAREVKNNPDFKYNKEQPKGYPVNTTDSTVVRDTLATQLSEAKTPKAIAHAKKELYEFQKNAGDKSITGKEGDADTIMIYKDSDGNDRIVYISNKQTLNDQQSSGTVNSSRRSILKAAEELNMKPKEKADVVQVAEEQFAKANKFDERFADGVKSATEKHGKRLSTTQAKSTMAKAAQALSGRSKMGKAQDKLSPEELANKRKYTAKSLKKPEVQAKLMGIDGPPNKDIKSKEYKEWKNKTAKQFKNEGKEYSDDNIVNAATMVTGTGGVSKGNHIRTNEKITIVTRDINGKMQKLVNDGLSPEDAAKKLKQQFTKPDKKGEVMYGNIFDEKDFIEIHSNAGLRDMEKAERGRGEDIKGMQTQTTAELKRLDKEAGHSIPPKNGPRTQAYVKGFLDRVHITQNVSGEADGRKLTEMGEHSVSPKDYRTALAKVTGFDSEEEYRKKNPDGNYNKTLETHLLENVEVEAGTMNLVYVSNQIDENTGKKKKVHIGTDTHRTGGSISKVAGQYGKDLQVEMAETSN